MRFVQNRVRQRRDMRMNTSEVPNDPQELAAFFGHEADSIPFLSPYGDRRLPQQSDVQCHRARFQAAQRRLTCKQASRL